MPIPTHPPFHPCLVLTTHNKHTELEHGFICGAALLPLLQEQQEQQQKQQEEEEVKEEESKSKEEGSSGDAAAPALGSSSGETREQEEEEGEKEGASAVPKQKQETEEAGDGERRRRWSWPRLLHTTGSQPAGPTDRAAAVSAPAPAAAKGGKGAEKEEEEAEAASWMGSLVWRYWREWPPALALLAAIVAADLTVQLPGCPRGYLGAGGRLLDGGAHWACTGAVHRMVDLSLLGAAHTAGAGSEPAAGLYWTEPFDRYGVLNAFVLAAVVGLVGLHVGGRASCLAHPALAPARSKQRGGKGKGKLKQGAAGATAVATSAAAAAAAAAATVGPPPLAANARLAALWAVVGGACVALSFVLERVAGIPCVPAMMTPSFLGWAVGTGLLALAVLYVLMGTPCLSTLLCRRVGGRSALWQCGGRGGRGEGAGEGGEEGEEKDDGERWTAPALVALGRNPLLVYVGHSLLKRRFPFGMASNGSLVEGLAAGCLGVASWAAVAYALERRGIVFRA
jgi:hypothetical protein